MKLRKKISLRRGNAVRLCVIPGADAFGFEGQPLWVWCLLPTVAGAVTYQVTTALLARERRFGPVAGAQVVNQACYVAAAAAIGFVASMTVGLVLARLLGQVLAAALLLLALSSIARVRIRFPSLGRVGPLWSRFHQFIVFNTPYSLVGVVGREMPIFAFAAISATTASSRSWTRSRRARHASLEPRTLPS